MWKGTGPEDCVLGFGVCYKIREFEVRFSVRCEDAKC